MKRKLPAIIMTLIISLSHFAYAAPIYEMTESEKAAGNIELITKKILINAGFVTVNIIKADLRDKDTCLTFLKDEKNLKTLYNTKTLTEKMGATAGINGDFYAKNSSSNEASSIGVEIKDGNLLSGYALSSTQMGVGAKLDDGSFFFDYIDTLTTITAPNGEGDVIKAYNKFDSLSGIVMYDRNWGNLSIGSTGNLEEMVVEDGIVTAINHDMGQIEIPENGYILAYLKDQNSFIPDNFKVGDEVKIDRVINPDIESVIDFAIGGGTILVTEGQKAKITHTAGVREPRSAWGVGKDGRYAYLVTVDGRTKTSVGVTLDEFSDILIDIGLYNAINLDGGGSSTLVAKRQGEDDLSVINNPSDSSLRGVINGVGIISEHKKGKISQIKLEFDKEKVFINTSSALNVTAMDKNYLGIDFDKEKVKFSLPKDAGYIKDFVFYPQKSGEVTVTAEYMGIKTSKKITVLDMPHSLKLSSKERKMKSGEKYLVTLRGYDEKGHSALIDLNHIGINVSDDILSFDGNTIKATRKGTSVVTFSFGDVSTSLIVRVDGDDTEVSLPEDVSHPDEKNVSKDIKSDEDNFSVAFFGNSFYNKTMLERSVAKNLILKIKDSCDMIFFAGKNVNISTELIPIHTSQKYSLISHKGVSFFTLNNASSSIHTPDKTQWKKFMEDIKSVKDKNIFIIMPNKYNFSSDTEEELFEKTISDYALSVGKDVYIFSNGVINSYRDNGKYMFNVDGVGNLNKQNVLSHAMYLKVNCENGNITYSFEKIFE